MSWNPKEDFLKDAKMHYKEIYQESPYSSSASMARFDSFRHAYSFAKLTRDYGEGLAEFVGDWNEILGRNEIEERRRDIYNNAVGREIG